MQTPLQVTFEGCEPSEAARVAIEREVARLEEHNNRIVSCRVSVIAPSENAAAIVSRFISRLQFHRTKISWSIMEHPMTRATNMSRSRSKTRFPPPGGKSMIASREVKPSIFDGKKCKLTDLYTMKKPKDED
jgi:hypothetical protein